MSEIISDNQKAMTTTKALSTREEMSKFASDIMNLMAELEITAMEAIVHYSQKNGIEIEVIAKLVNKDLKSILKEEAASLNFLRYKNGKVIRPKKQQKLSLAEEGKKKKRRKSSARRAPKAATKKKSKQPV